MKEGIKIIYVVNTMDHYTLISLRRKYTLAIISKMVVICVLTAEMMQIVT